MTIDLCDPHTFPPSDFFEQHPLSKKTDLNFPYQYTKAYFITATGTQIPGGGALSALSNLVFTSTSLDLPGSKGIPNTAKTPWEVVLHDLFVQHGFIDPNPLNIQIYEPSRVIILLVGSFWEFSRVMEPISTKLDTGDRYFDVQRHGWNGHTVVTPTGGMPCRAISFFADTPCNYTLGVRHGFSLNVEFRGAGGNGVLPITVDPDVENKGGLP